MNIYLAKRIDPDRDIAWGHNVSVVFTAENMKEALTIADKYILYNGGVCPVFKPDSNTASGVNQTFPFLTVNDIIIVEIGVTTNQQYKGDVVKDDPRIICLDNVGA